MVTISRSSTYSRGPVTGRARTSMALTLLICCGVQWVGGDTWIASTYAPKPYPCITSLPRVWHPQPAGCTLESALASLRPQALIQLCDRLDIGTLPPRNTLLVLCLPFAASSFVSHSQLMIQGLG